jgi:hypothetical protein
LDNSGTGIDRDRLFIWQHDSAAVRDFLRIDCAMTVVKNSHPPLNPGKKKKATKMLRGVVLISRRSENPNSPKLQLLIDQLKI